MGIQWHWDGGRDDSRCLFGPRLVGAGLLGLHLIAGLLEAGRGRMLIGGLNLMLTAGLMEAGRGLMLSGGLDLMLVVGLGKLLEAVLKLLLVVPGQQGQIRQLNHRDRVQLLLLLVLCRCLGEQLLSRQLGKSERMRMLLSTIQGGGCCLLLQQAIRALAQAGRGELLALLQLGMIQLSALLVLGMVQLLVLLQGMLHVVCDLIAPSPKRMQQERMRGGLGVLRLVLRLQKILLLLLLLRHDVERARGQAEERLSPSRCGPKGSVVKVAIRNLHRGRGARQGRQGRRVSVGCSKSRSGGGHQSGTRCSETRSHLLPGPTRPVSQAA